MNSGGRQISMLTWSLLLIIVLLSIILTQCPTNALPHGNEKFLKMSTNLRGCHTSVYSSTEKWAPCPSAMAMNPLDWPCIRVSDLCNGRSDCPNGEDEDQNMCMFHQLNQGILRRLQRDFVHMIVGGSLPGTPRFPARDLVEVRQNEPGYLEFERITE